MNPAQAARIEEPLLAVRALHKHFGATRALDGVDFELAPAEVHALCGENGAGKSTLVRILSGILIPDSGSIDWNGMSLHTAAPTDACGHGIAVIHQDFDLAPNLSVAENLVLGREPRRWRMLVDRTSEQRSVGEALDRVGLDVAPGAPTGRLSAAQRQLLAIARALSQKARLLVMDEPTSSLGPDDTDRLLGLVEQLRARGTSVIFISHKLDEVFRIADRITVLRDGRSVATLDAHQASEAQVIDLMVGRELGEALGRGNRVPGNELLEVSGLGRGSELNDIEFTLHRSEILGIYGLQGAGRTRLAEALFGLAPADRGLIRVGGEELEIDSPRTAMRHGIALVPEDRRVKGLFANMDVRENLTIADLPALQRAGLIDRARERAAAGAAAAEMGVRLSDLGQAVGELSGGNQQKALLARWLMREPQVLILDEPTAGVDVGAKADIYARLDAIAVAGAGVLLITSEMPELLGVCDRVLVMNQGAIVARFARGEASEAGIMRAIQGA
jgi:ABC-type sugar transport system ATPase subunit